MQRRRRTWGVQDMTVTGGTFLAPTPGTLGIADDFTVLTETESSVAVADQDSHVSGFQEDSNFGSSSQLLVKNQSPTDTGAFSRKAYVRFDVATLPSSEFSLILNVVDSGLGITSASKDYEFEVYGLNHAESEDDWIETGVGSIA